MANDNKLSCCHAEDFKYQDSSFNVITVDDPRYAEPHFLLVETTISESRTVRSGLENSHFSKIDLKIRYLFGPDIAHIGHMVAHWGGETLYRGTVKLTNGEVMIKVGSLRGLHIGTYAFSRIVAWAKRLGDDLLVHPIRISVVDAYDNKNKKRRNSMYENFGLRFAYRESNGIPDAEGSSLSTMTVRDLIAYENWPNIHTTHWLDGFKELAEAFRTERRERREHHRLYMLHRRRADRFEQKVAVVARYFHMAINWPLYVIVACIAFGVGQNWSGWRSFASRLWVILESLVHRSVS